MNKFNNKKGISLIVLVITIIVMIILAAAIILSLQSSGIIGKANEAKTKMNSATLKEVYSIKLMESMISNDKGEIECLKETIEELGIEDDFKIDESSKRVTYSGEDFEIKCWIADTFTVKSLKDLVEAGYVCTAIDGEIYITGLDTEDKRKADIIISKGYEVKDNTESKAEVKAGSYITTDYTIYKDDELMGTIVYFGDIDYSFDITALDASEIVSYCLGAPDTFTYAQLLAGDVNQDRIISGQDAIYIQDYLLGRNYEIIQNRKIEKLYEEINASVEDVIETFDINDATNIEETIIEGEKAYKITLNDDYTYKELTEKLSSKAEISNIYYHKDNNTIEVENDSIDKIESGAVIMLDSIIMKMKGDNIYRSRNNWLILYVN